MYRKNTAGQFICVQLILAATGADATGLSPTVRRCIDGTFAAGGGTFTEDGTTGNYKYAMSQADTNGNDISFNVKATGAISVTLNIVTTAADPTDTVHFGLTSLPNTAVTTNASLLTSGTGTDQLHVSSGHVSNVDTLTTYTGNTVQTGDAFARLGAPAGASVSADVAAVKSDTGTILTDVNTGAGAIYSRLGAPAGASMSADIASVKTSVGSVTGSVGSVVAAVAVTSNVKKNSALANFAFEMLNAAGTAPATGLTVAATRRIDNGAFASCANAVTEIANGWYTIDLAASDLNGNVIAFRMSATGGSDNDFTIITQP